MRLISVVFLGILFSFFAFSEQGTSTTITDSQIAADTHTGNDILDPTLLLQHCDSPAEIAHQPMSELEDSGHVAAAISEQGPVYFGVSQDHFAIEQLETVADGWYRLTIRTIEEAAQVKIYRANSIDPNAIEDLHQDYFSQHCGSLIEVILKAGMYYVGFQIPSVSSASYVKVSVGMDEEPKYCGQTRPNPENIEKFSKIKIKQFLSPKTDSFSTHWKLNKWYVEPKDLLVGYLTKTEDGKKKYGSVEERLSHFPLESVRRIFFLATGDHESIILGGLKFKNVDGDIEQETVRLNGVTGEVFADLLKKHYVGVPLQSAMFFSACEANNSLIRYLAAGRKKYKDGKPTEEYFYKGVRDTWFCGFDRGVFSKKGGNIADGDRIWYILSDAKVRCFKDQENKDYAISNIQQLWSDDILYNGKEADEKVLQSFRSKCKKSFEDQCKQLGTFQPNRIALSGGIDGCKCAEKEARLELSSPQAESGVLALHSDVTPLKCSPYIKERLSDFCAADDQ